MKKRHRQHINPLKMTCLIPRDPLELPAEKVIEIELGCADALFLIERAQAHAERYFFGLDIREEFLADGDAEIARRGLDNISLQICNLLIDTPHLFGRGAISRFFINFPDPWFKRRQRARRWLTRSTLDDLVAALTPEGEILFQSDVWDLVLEALELLESHADLQNARGEWTFLRDTPFSARSTRDLICARDGLPVWRLLYRRVSV